MARREKKPVHKVVMTEGKRNIIQQLLQEYDIETAEDIQDALKDLLGGTIKEMMEAKGMTTRQISETIEDIYGFEISEGFISDVTDKIMPQDRRLQNRPLDEVYPILYIDAIHYSVRDNGVIRKLAAYIILGINTEGKKEVLSITVGDNESSKYWLSVLNELKTRGVKDKRYSRVLRAGRACW